jgi:hypothetical protein
MESFYLALGVRDRTYTRQQHRDLETGEYETRRSIVLRCVWNDGSGFMINGQPFFEPITVVIGIGEPIPYSEPLDLDFVGTHYLIDSGIGGARFNPKSVSADSGDVTDSSLHINLLVSSEVFAEMLEMRHELKTLHLDAIGDKIHVDIDGEPSWSYSNPRENALYITGFNYVTVAA